MIGTGTIVGSYEILERLGTGGMGEVYRARHLHLDRQAAIKMLLVELSQDREAVDRFFAEARATSLIHHPGIVEMLDCNVHESGRVYLVMELLEGETLANRLRRDPEMGRDLPLVLSIADQIADALGAAHARGIIHRDLKPENVFLVDSLRAGEPPRVKVLDFGIAKLLNSRGGSTDAAQVNTQADRVLGTPAYMSPEQCRDARFVDHRTDIYALGCVLHEMIAGHVPFEASTFGQLVAAQLWEQPPPLPPPAAGLVGRMLAKEPAARLQTMNDVRTEIARVLRRARAEGSRAGLGQLRRRWETFWEGRVAHRLPPLARPLGRWVAVLMGSRHRLVGLGVGWVVLVAMVAVVALRERGAPGQPAPPRMSTAVMRTAAPRAPVIGRAPHVEATGARPGVPAVPQGSPPPKDSPALSRAPRPADDTDEVDDGRPASSSTSSAMRRSPPRPPLPAPPMGAPEPRYDDDAPLEPEDQPARAARSAPRSRAQKASDVRPAAARIPRANPAASGIVELTDDQRKL